MYYFAYGSNMSLARLRQRTPSARRVSVAFLEGHRLRFHKVSQRDGSAKCDAPQTDLPQDHVWGVVYRIAEAERPVLDCAEGLGMGYRLAWVNVRLVGGEPCRTFLYLATQVDERLLPFTWYKQHVLIGARENRLPEAYIRRIERVQACEDEDRQRHRQEMAIHQWVGGC
jgi:cation transport regulator ChaC